MEGLRNPTADNEATQRLAKTRSCPHSLTGGTNRGDGISGAWRGGPPWEVGTTAAYPVGGGTTGEPRLLLETCQSPSKREKEKK